MRALSDRRIPVVPLEKVRNVPNGVAITFDDGFSNFIEHALPLLQRYGFPAAVFAVTRYVGRRNDWPKQPAGVPVLPLMSWDDLAGIAGEEITVGAHTLTHPSLWELSPPDMEKEIRGSKLELEERLHKEVQLFSYPYGHWNDAVLKTARKHFAVCCTTELNYVERGCHPWTLPRIDAYYVRSLFWFNHIPGKLGRAYIQARRCARTVRQLIAA